MIHLDKELPRNLLIMACVWPAGGARSRGLGDVGDGGGDVGGRGGGDS